MIQRFLSQELIRSNPKSYDTAAEKIFFFLPPHSPPLSNEGALQFI